MVVIPVTSDLTMIGFEEWWHALKEEGKLEVRVEIMADLSPAETDHLGCSWVDTRRIFGKISVALRADATRTTAMPTRFSGRHRRWILSSARIVAGTGEDAL